MHKVIKNIYKSLKNNGEFIMWVYGYENNEIYITIFDNLEKFLQNYRFHCRNFHSYLQFSHIHILICAK